VKHALRKLGQDIALARRRRRISTTLLAQRAFITRNTLRRAESGDAGVSIGIYATLLFVLGIVDRLADLADPGRDPLAVALEEERIPRRIRTPRVAEPPGSPQ
jgi:transcriptional regulator with XRE-family HTH domain